MDVQQLFNNLRKEAECPLCLETVNEPKTLPCLHSFCLHCLDNLAGFARRQLQTTIKCPVCLTAFQIPDADTFHGLPTSFHLNRLVDILALKDGNTEAQSCSSCEEGNAVTCYCFVCQSFLCKACLEAHQRLKATRGHRNVLIEKLQAPDVEELIHRPVMCAEKYHQNEALEYYCIDCRVCICMKCGFVNHNRHTMVDIQQAAEERKIQITETVDKAKAQVVVVEGKINRQIELMKKSTDEMRTAQNKNTAIVDELVRILREQERTLNTKLGKINQAQRQDHARRLENFQFVVSQLNGFVERGKGILQRAIASEILQAEQTVTDRYKELLNASETKIYRPHHFAYIPNNETKQVMSALKRSGLGRAVASLTDPLQSEAERKGLEKIKSGSEASFTVITRDSDGNQIYNEGDQVTVKIRYPTGDCEVEDSKIKDLKDGTYKVSYKPECVSQHEVSIELNGIPLNGSPWKIQMTPIYKPVSNQFVGHEKFSFPCSIAQSEKTGNIAVGDFDSKKVLLFDSSLKYLGTVVDFTPKRKPRSVAFTKFFNVIVVSEESHESSKISVFTEDGDFVQHVTEHVINPCSVSVSRTDGRITVCDSGDNSVKVLSPDEKKLLHSFKVPNYDAFPWFAVHHQEKYFVSYRMPQCVKVFDEAGVPLYDIGQLNRVAGIAIDKLNQLLVCDTGKTGNCSRVQVFSLNGKLLGCLALDFFGNCFCSVAVTQNGHVLVSDANNGSIRVFEKDAN